MSKVLLRSINLNVNIYQRVYVEAKRDIKIGLIVQHCFFCAWFQGKEFREWILKKLIQGEQACHRATGFAKLHVSVSSNAFVCVVKGEVCSIGLL